MYERLSTPATGLQPRLFRRSTRWTSTGAYRLRGGWCDAYAAGTNNGSSVGQGAIIGNPPAAPTVAAGEVIGHGRINISGSVMGVQAVVAANGQFTLDAIAGADGCRPSTSAPTGRSPNEYRLSLDRLMSYPTAVI